MYLSTVFFTTIWTTSWLYASALWNNATEMTTFYSEAKSHWPGCWSENGLVLPWPISTERLWSSWTFLVFRTIEEILELVWSWYLSGHTPLRDSWWYSNILKASCISHPVVCVVIPVKKFVFLCKPSCWWDGTFKGSIHLLQFVSSPSGTNFQCQRGGIWSWILIRPI